MEVFNTPRNRFVAGFIGSPSMNFFRVKSDGKRSLTGDGFTITLPCDLPETTGTLELGIRPQAFTLASDSTPKSELWNVHVDVVERLGPETFVYFKVGGQVATAKLPPNVQITPGESLSLTADTGNVHVFSETGEALLHTGAQATH